MKRIGEIKVLRWSIAALFAIEIVQLVRTTQPALAEPPVPSTGKVSASTGAVAAKPPAMAPPRLRSTVPPVQTHPAFVLSRRPLTTAMLNDRITALEAQIDSLVTYTNALQTQLDGFYNTYRTHTHQTSVGFMTREDYSCDSSVLGLSHICTREGLQGGGGGTFGVATTDANEPYFNITDIPRPDPRH